MGLMLGAANYISLLESAANLKGLGNTVSDFSFT